MENFGEKMGMKTFWSVFGWVGRKENKWWNPDVVSPCPPKSSLSKMKKKLRGKIGHHFWTKMPMCNCTWACPRCSSSFFFSFSFSFLLNIASSPLFFFFFFTGQAPYTSSAHILFFFFGLDVIFFSIHDFYFLINLGD